MSLADEIAAALPCIGAPTCGFGRLVAPPDDLLHLKGCPATLRPAVLALIERREADWRRLVDEIKAEADVCTTVWKADGYDAMECYAARAIRARLGLEVKP